MPRSDVDLVARKLGRLARLARRMPPAWRGARIHHPLCGPEGQVIGRILPGEGLYLDCDLKHLGITTKVAHVVERSPMRRALDTLQGEAAAITTMAGLQAAIQAGQGQVTFGPITQQLGAAANIMQWTDSYQSLDVNGNRSTYPASPNGAVMTQASARALNGTMLSPSGSNTSYLIGFGVSHQGGTSPAGDAMHIIMDVLIGLGAIGNNVTTSISLTPPALTRYTSGAGVMALVEQEVANNPLGTTVTLTYTNQAGLAGQSTTVSMNTSGATIGPGGSSIGDTTDSAEVGVPFFCLASGDYGVQSVSAIQWQAAQGSGSTGCVILYYPLCFIAGSVATNDYFENDLTSMIHGLVPLQAASGALGCLELLTMDFVANTTTNCYTAFKTVQG
jgi:hypothetical protein